jgi:tetratricopeptide (TPR) repeat protein
MENNPYHILGISQAASKAEITKAVAVAMKRKQHPVDAIAKAQKSLLKSEERIIADYLRPVLPIIRRFKSTDLSPLNQPAPILALLSEFDGIERAIASSIEAERLEREPLVTSLAQLYSEGVTAYQEQRYPKAIQYLEDYCQRCVDQNDQDYLQAQMSLVNAYHESRQYPEAIALCKQLSNHPDSQVQIWANENLLSMSKEVFND